MHDEVDEIVAAWRRERPDLDVAPLEVLSRISRLADVVADRRAEAFVEHGLQAHEFDVLTVLRRAGEPFELTAGELSALTHVTSGTMTSRLDRLTQRKLVTRHADPSDGRLVRVRLTAAGRQAGRRRVRGAGGVRAGPASPGSATAPGALADVALRELLLATAPGR
jgi:DNA-binding MarR family transcriptional regulator